jgi:hypothetical protein
MQKNSSLFRASAVLLNSADRLAVAFPAAFLGILFLLHFLEPEFNPLWRMISEYELGRFGWMMRLAFFCWGLGVLFLLLALWPSIRTAAGRIGRAWLVLIVVALFGAGIYVTNAITDTTLSTVNSLHTLSGAFVILTFPVASTLVVRSLLRNKEWAPFRRQLFWLELLVWLGMLVFFGSIIVSDAINPGAGRAGPQVYLGWPNRFLVTVYAAWIIVIALDAKKNTPRR